jgi:hypothetical protein
MKSLAPRIVGPNDGKVGFLGAIGVRGKRLEAWLYAIALLSLDSAPTKDEP